ncbi:hypothetical protein [Pseudomonas nunensis]|uniref:Uncharacterized protein n=1 Tax=Pseudomonas nunensis TaxID=2961896 RepID=A0ABY5EPR0_9PSED|nr:hypothetical protein [Pseudomonas nunensis]KPN90538.1 hypothetical protein AL066_09385 [Pseudomonas nunensis]MCL5225456.1 hypothetical protein [Pseudomonas nunensis]UTO16785.1 hypothetical protein NK667_10680 [Pseudomonas nunensis]
MGHYREQRDRLNERVEMLARLGDQSMQSKPGSLEHVLLSKVMDVFWSANHLMNEELEKLNAAGLDQTIYPDS